MDTEMDDERDFVPPSDFYDAHNSVEDSLRGEMSEFFDDLGQQVFWVGRRVEEAISYLRQILILFILLFLLALAILAAVLFGG